MRRLLVWTWKEAREHAARVRLLLVSIPVLTLLAGWIWAETLTQNHGDELSFGFVAGALVLHGLVVASSLFATDVGESAPAPAQRLPGGLGAAFVAKGFTWFVTALVAVVVGAFATAGVLWLVGQPERAWDVLTPWHHSDGLQQVAFAGEALVYSACVALAAACVRHPGSAVACGTILFGLLLGGVLLGWRADSSVFPLDDRQSLVLESLALALLTLGLVAAWFVGRRRVAAGWRAAALAGGVIVALYGAGAVHAARAIERAREPDVSAADWRIERVLICKGEHVAFAQLERLIGAWPMAAGSSDDSAAMVLLDLERGGWRRIGRRGAFLGLLPHNLTLRAPFPPMHAHERVVVMQGQDRLDAFSLPAEVLWFDGATGAQLHQELDGYPDARGVAFQRDMLRDFSEVRDSQGRKTWLFDGFLEREGGVAPIGVPAVARSERVLFPVRAGSDAWWIRMVPGSRQAPFDTFAWIDADTGRTLKLPQELFPPCYDLSRGRLLARRSPTNDRKTATWQVLDLATGEATPALGMPWPRALPGLCGLAGDRVLCTAKGSMRDLLIWDPIRGESTRLSLPDLGAEIRSLSPLDLDVRGRCLLRIGCGGELAEGRGEGWVLISPDPPDARLLLRPWSLPGELEPLHVREDGAVLFLVEGRRIVRVGPETDRIETLFPREGK